ncbi:class I SAM-dependent methyltransferase [Oryzobacter telluris]|uniref:class I SAM-dependent methyltransferase n=1 Tax=Oryzobacter telluris TaxID=3149179 RepID=UPI00370D501E
MEADHRDPTPPEGLRELWPDLDAVPGWLTLAQAVDLWDAVAAAPAHPVVVEVGSHHGRSTVVLASARTDVRVTAVDPFVTARLFAGPSVREAFEATVRRFDVTDRVHLRVTTSRAARAGWSGPVDVVYVDGKHDVLTVGDDLRWVDHVRGGGTVLVHDAFSSVGVTLGLLLHALPSSRLRYTGRTGSLARFVVAPPTLRDRLRLVTELPWFARNVVVKVLLRLRLRAVARRLGHADSYDPY